MFKLFFSAFLFLPFIIFFVQQGRGIFATSAFVVWYLAFGATLNTQTLIMVSIVYIFIVALFSALGKVRHINTPLIGIIAEDITSALIPCALFFVDVGFLSWLNQKFSLTYLVGIESLLMYLPIWTLYGLWHTKKETGIINFLKVASVLYVVTILMFGFIPNIPQFAGDIRAPTVADIQKAKENAQAKIKGENPALSAVVCAFTEPTNQNCAQDRQAASKCKDACGTEKITTAAVGVRARTKECEDCLAKAKGLAPAVQVPGAVDPTQREPTVVAIEMSRGADGRGVDAIGPFGAVSALVSWKNPRTQRFKIVVGCYFKQMEGGQEKNTPGSVVETIEVSTKEHAQSVKCSHEQPLMTGSATAVFLLDIQGLTTTTSLERFFVGDKKDLEDEIRQKFFPTTESTQSKGPPDYVRLDFEIGQPRHDPIIRQSSPQVWATLKNNGDGEITHIREALLWGFSHLDVIKAHDCSLEIRDAEGVPILVNPLFSLPVTQKDKPQEKLISYGLCELQIDDVLRSPDKPVPYLFYSKVIYDYKITKEFPLTVLASGVSTQ